MYNLFENDVKEYGTQALRVGEHIVLMFENDVKEYGTQAIVAHAPILCQFENDVKEYGTQAAYLSCIVRWSLRMM